MRFGLCTSLEQVEALPWDLLDFLEAPVQHFLVPEQPDDAFAPLLARARRLPVPVEAVNNLLPPDLVLIEAPGRTIDRPRLARYLEVTCARAAEAGVRVVVVGSGTARDCPQGVSPAEAAAQVAAHLREWAGMAARYCVCLALEPLRRAETRTINTLADGAAVVAAADRPPVRLLADIYHMACNGESPADLARYGSLLTHVHLAEQENRAAPGRHGDDFRPWFASLRAAGYDDRLSIECRWQDMAAEAPRAMRRLRAQWEASVAVPASGGASGSADAGRNGDSTQAPGRDL